MESEILGRSLMNLRKFPGTIKHGILKGQKLEELVF